MPAASLQQKPKGRKRLDTPSLKAKIVADYGECGSISLVADLHGISRESIRLWSHEDPEFLADLTRARGAKAMGHVRNLNAIPDAKVDTWWLSRLYRSDYGEKVEHSGPEGGPIAIFAAAVDISAAIRANPEAFVEHERLIAGGRTVRPLEPGRLRDDGDGGNAIALAAGKAPRKSKPAPRRHRAGKAAPPRGADPAPARQE